MQANPFLLTGILLFTFSFNLHAQQKLEREYHVKEQQIPSPALAFTNECFGEVSVKWYGEESLTGKTYEAKVKVGHRAYSVEFDTLGNIEDVELLIDFDDIAKNSKSRIKEKLSRRFIRYKVRRCQLQWLGGREALAELITRGETTRSYRSRYELVLTGKSAGKNELYEFLFDGKGNMLRSAVIIQRNTHNLFY